MSVDQSQEEDEVRKEIHDLLHVAPKKDLVGWCQKVRMLKARVFNLELKKAGPEGPILLRNRFNVQRHFLVQKSMVTDGWRVTEFDEMGPFGHVSFADREDALKACLGIQPSTNMAIGSPSYMVIPITESASIQFLTPQRRVRAAA